MCLGIPMKIVRIEGNKGIVAQAGIKHEVSFDLIDDPQMDEYVLIHAGFAIEKLDEEEAKETLDMIREMASE